MPELPEVEVIRRGLSKKIIGLKIQKVEILNSKSFQGDAKKVKGKVISKVWRRGKVLGIDMSIDYGLQTTAKNKKSRRLLAVDGSLTLLFHLKMSGQLILISNSESERYGGGHPTSDMLGPMPNRSTRVILHLASNLKPLTSNLYFNDQRKFGWIKLVDSSRLTAHDSLQALGPEPLDPEFTWQILKNNLLRHKSIPIKVALLDQTAVAGIGNIYACEALFHAKIHPQKRIIQLTDSDFQRLHKGIVKSLKLSIEKGGSSRRNYLNESGQKGYFLDFAYVYDRYKLLCKICNTPISKIKLAGRGTYFCPKCQHNS